MSEKLKIIDLHCDTILGCYIGKNTLRDYPGHISAEKLRAGGSLAQCFALFIPTHDSSIRHFGEERDPWDVYQDLLRCYRENTRCKERNVIRIDLCFVCQNRQADAPARLFFRIKQPPKR